MISPIVNYQNQEVSLYQINGGSIAVRVVGKGRPLVFIHGFPTHGYTWRKLLPQLSKHYQCLILDLPGLGDSTWTSTCKFDTTAQSERVIILLKQLNIEKCAIIAHDSGASIARFIAIEHPNLVSHLIMMNTEIPNHRPPWIPFYQKVSLLPLAPMVIQQMLKSKYFRNSSMGFREAYSDKTMLDNPENLDPYLQEFIKSKRKADGAFKYLRGIDWKLIDNFESLHKEIKAETLFLWGEDDKTFPIEIGKTMVAQFNNNCQFVTIKNASLLPHEEQSEVIISSIFKFLETEVTA